MFGDSTKMLAFLSMVAGAMAAIGTYAGPGTYYLSCDQVKNNRISAEPSAAYNVTSNSPTDPVSTTQVFEISEVGNIVVRNETLPVVRIVNYASGLALTAPSTAGSNGNVVQGPPSPSVLANRFYISKSPFPRDVDNVQFHSLYSSGADPVLDIRDSSGTSGTPLIVFPNRGTSAQIHNQVWRLVRQTTTPQ